jgi:CRISPR-associated protein Csb3
MTEFVMHRADVRVLLWHMALYGLGAILQDAAVPDVRLSWTSGMQPRARITGEGLTDHTVDDVVREHARRHAVEPSWMLRNVNLGGSLRGLMSPRLTPFGDPQVWQQVQDARHREVDLLTESRAWLDLRQISALGEPCYWSRNRQNNAMQDDGASRLEMQPRNQGSEFVGTRLRRLAQVVSARYAGSVVTGIEGSSTMDEAGSDKVDSRTATGLANPGPIDNALAWCALWGISQFPITPQINGTAHTSGHLGRTRSEWFYTPVWEASWSPARLRSLLVARQLRDAAGTGLDGRWATDPALGVAAGSWLAARGVVGVVRFPIERFGSDSAPERRAMLGVPLPIADK